MNCDNFLSEQIIQTIFIPVCIQLLKIGDIARIKKLNEMSDNSLSSVWVFNSAGAKFPGAVFISYDKALNWIAEHKLSGVLTLYPLDTGVFEWAVKEGHFVPNENKHLNPSFIGGFTTASQSHFHFIDGLLDCD